jgi:hypothetical protein
VTVILTLQVVVKTELVPTQKAFGIMLGLWQVLNKHWVLLLKDRDGFLSNFNLLINK